MPDVVELEEPACDRLEEAAGKLGELGLSIERFGPNAMLVRAVPHSLRKSDPAQTARRYCRRLGKAWRGAVAR